MDVSPEIRERVEARYRGAIWKVYVCAEADGEECEPSLRSGGVRHRCSAPYAKAAEAFVEVQPRMVPKG